MRPLAIGDHVRYVDPFGKPMALGIAVIVDIVECRMDGVLCTILFSNGEQTEVSESWLRRIG